MCQRQGPHACSCRGLASTDVGWRWRCPCELGDDRARAGAPSWREGRSPPWACRAGVGGWLTVMTVAVTAGGKDPRQKTPAQRTEAPDPCPGRSLLLQRLPLGLVGSAQKVGSGGG